MQHPTAEHTFQLLRSQQPAKSSSLEAHREASPNPQFLLSPARDALATSTPDSDGRYPRHYGESVDDFRSPGLGPVLHVGGDDASFVPSAAQHRLDVDSPHPPRARTPTTSLE